MLRTAMPISSAQRKSGSRMPVPFIQPCTVCAAPMHTRQTMSTNSSCSLVIGKNTGLSVPRTARCDCGVPASRTAIAPPRAASGAPRPAPPAGCRARAPRWPPPCRVRARPAGCGPRRNSRHTLPPCRAHRPAISSPPMQPDQRVQVERAGEAEADRVLHDHEQHEQHEQHDELPPAAGERADVGAQAQRREEREQQRILRRRIDAELDVRHEARERSGDGEQHAADHRHRDAVAREQLERAARGRARRNRAPWPAPASAAG